MLDPLSMYLPYSSKHFPGADMRVQEMIHGHRFIPEQEPFMLVLETLAVCAAVPLGTHVQKDNVHESFSYELPHRKKMRFLLFVDRQLEKIARDGAIPDHKKWETWKEHVNKQFEPKWSGHDHFAYLDNSFEQKIHSLSQAVRILRSMELDVIHDRRWTSRFLAVNGPDMICTDVRQERSGRWSADRRFFGRGGELVYLMLNRSPLAQEINQLLHEQFLNEDDPINKIAKALCDPRDDINSTTRIGYLPLRRHPAYERLAQDWYSILNRELPSGHVFESLFRITGLNLAVYLVERAGEEIGTDPEREPIVADFTDGLDKQLRDLSKGQLNDHRWSANRAVEAYVTKQTNNDDGWAEAVSLNSSKEAKRAIERLFNHKSDETRLSPENQLKELMAQAKSRDKNNAYTFLLPLTKNIGLATSRPRVGTWFGIDDKMIFALVMANVTNTVELKFFVKTLYERYGLVIGPDEARNAFEKPPVGIQSFESNLAALENRMTRLELTQRLSDDCAFVMNPYRQDNE